MTNNILATQEASEKIKEIINGSKTEFNTFIESLKVGDLIESNFNFFREGSTRKFYYKRCKNIYAIFVISNINTIIIVDILTESEFTKLKG